MLENKELITKLRKERKTYSEIGELLGVTRQRIQQVCKKLNIQKAQREPKKTYLEKKKEAFISRINKTDTACWEWTGAKLPSSYGILSFYGQRTYAHRVSYLLFKDPTFKLFQEGRNKEDSQHILHTCDNPSCVNPEHLKIGTPGENMKDRDSKGRNRYQRAKRASLI